MSTRNLLIALTITLLVAAFADRIFAHRSAVTEAVLRLPPITAAIELEVQPKALQVTEPVLRAIQNDLRLAQREELDRYLNLKFKQALGDVTVSPD